jgi:hypothetical protein
MQFTLHHLFVRALFLFLEIAGGFCIAVGIAYEVLLDVLGVDCFLEDLLLQVSLVIACNARLRFHLSDFDSLG